MIHAVAPAASNTPKRSGALAAVRIPTIAITTNSAMTSQRAEQAQLLADDREDEVGVCRGRNRHLADPHRTRRRSSHRVWSAISDCVTW